jgi:hypothetical protein
MKHNPASDKPQHHSLAGNAIALSQIAAFAAAFAVATAPRAETAFTPTVVASATWTDNIELVSDAAGPQAEYVLQLNPGFRLTQDDLRMDSKVVYTMQNLFFKNDGDRDTTYHQFDGSTTIEALSEWFYVDAAATYTQVLIDPEQPTSNGNLFDTGNISDAVTARVTPRLAHKFGTMRVDASYTRGFVDYRQTDEFGNAIEDTDNEAAAFRIGSEDENEHLTWGLHYDGEKAEYDVSPTFKYEKAGADVGWATSSALQLLGRAGYESDLEVSTSEGGLDSAYWKVGFRWHPSDLNQFELLAGERFFGDSVEARWTRTGRMLRLELRYTEEPTTEAQRFALRPVTGTPLDQPPDADDFARLTPEVYIAKRLSSYLALIGRRTEVKLEVSTEEREYIEANETEDVYKFVFSILRQLNARTSLRLNAGMERSELRTGEDSDDTSAAITLARTFSPTSNLSLVAAYAEREGDLENYDSTAVTLRFDKDF